MLLAGLAAVAAGDRLGVGAAVAQHSQLEITARPSLYPAFSSQVRDYVVWCSRRHPVRLSVSAPPGTTVSVDGGRFRRGDFDARALLASGQSLKVVVAANQVERAYSVRCLPPNFPRWTFDRFGRPQAAYYIVAPCCSDHYAIMFDTNGVPVWWLHTHDRILDAGLLPDGDVDVGVNGGKHFGLGVSLATFKEFRLDGTYVRTFLIPHGPPTDRHELQVLPNGDYVVAAHVPQTGVDLRPYGGPADATVLDAMVAEVSPSGKLVWTWNSEHHIALSETGRWYQGLVLSSPARLSDGRPAYDIVHINAIAPYRHGFLVSMRHTDAVYAIAKPSGRILWKLGGTHTRKSLRIIGDDVPDFGGQHDVRALPDGTVSVFDNGTGRDRPPRVLRFRINAKARTATLIERLVDNQTGDSPCCGSARKLPGGDWVVSWGGTDLISEMTPGDQPVINLWLKQQISYRAPPVLPGQLSRRALDAGMDAMHPRNPPRG